MTTLRRPRLGLRREVLILLPVSVLVLVLLSAFVLLSYRNALNLLVEERQGEAAMIARRAAERTPPAPTLTAAALQRLVPGAERIALVDEGGTAVLTTAPFERDNLLAPLGAQPFKGQLAAGPSPEVPERVAGFAPLRRGSRTFYLRVDLSTPELARQLRALKTLSWVALPINLLLATLVLVFLRHFLEPFETLLVKARQTIGEPRDEDEISFLLSSFERAMTSMASSDEESSEVEIQALQRALAPSLESGLLLLDREGSVLSLNPLGASLLEVEEPSPGAPLADVVSPHPELLATLQEAVASGRGIRRGELVIRLPSGERTLGLTAHGLRRDDGSVRGFLVLFVDLTEVRRAADEKRLADSLAQLGELAAGLAHELRNSLATLRGYLDLIERRPGEESITDYLSEIRRESEHLARVLEDFLSFARPETTRVEEVDLLRLARRAAADPALEGKRVEILAGGLSEARIRGDEQLLERALRNLLRNAVTAEQQVATEGLEVHLGRTGEGLELAVVDRGSGVPDEVRSRLFQPFVSGSGGVGLGLSLTHRIATLHGGKLRLEARQGGGTRAVLVFPSDTIVT
jgi:signal transduction histidine kinase